MLACPADHPVDKNRRRDPARAPQGRDDQSDHSEDAVGCTQVPVQNFVTERAEGAHHQREQGNEDVVVAEGSNRKTLGEDRTVDPILGLSHYHYRDYVAGKVVVYEDSRHRATAAHIDERV